MKRKYRIDRIFICLLILILIIFLIIFIIKKISNKEEYTIEYNVNNIDIKETYNNDLNTYYYNITYNSLSYDFIYKSEYLDTKKLINGIKKYNDSNETCIVIESNYFNLNPLCSKDNIVIDYHLVNDTLKDKLSKYYKTTNESETQVDNYILYNNEDNIILWNYNGISYLKDNKLTTIKIFKKDFYDVSLSSLINNYFIVADYNQEYTFNKFYIVDLNTSEVSEWNLNTEISFDSYILGTKDKSIYLVDQKNKVEYEFVPHKQKMRIISSHNKGYIYDNGIEESISMDKLISKSRTFNSSLYKFTIIDNKLYSYYEDINHKTLISNQEVDKIVYQKDDSIYYLIDTTLYKYNNEYGEIKLMSYSEWKYNNTNVIFIE